MSGLTALHLAAMKGYNELVFSLITQHHSQKDALTLVRPTPSVSGFESHLSTLQNDLLLVV